MVALLKFAIFAFTTLFYISCSQVQPQYVDDSHKFVSFGLDNHDISNMAKTIATSLLNHSHIKKQDELKVLSIGPIDNETYEIIDTEFIANEITKHLSNSGKFIFVNAGRNEKIEHIIKESRKMRDNKEYNQYTTIEEGNLIAPHYALIGKITQHNKTINKDEIVEYTFSFTLTDLSLGTIIWVGNDKVSKKLPKDEVANYSTTNLGYSNESNEYEIVTKEQLLKEFAEKIQKKKIKQKEMISQIKEFQYATTQCNDKKNKKACEKAIDLLDEYCNNGLAAMCYKQAEIYFYGINDKKANIHIKADLDKAKKYIIKTCNLDTTFCVVAYGLLDSNNDKDNKLAIKYTEKTCEAGEYVACYTAYVQYETGIAVGVDKNPTKAKYYKNKLCRIGITEFCR